MQGTLIIVDVQKGFVTPCSSHILAQLDKLQYQFEHVIFTKFYNPYASPFRKILDYHKLPPNHPDTELAISPRHDAIILTHGFYTSLTVELCLHLERLKMKNVYVSGIATEACVMKTVVDLFEYNIRPYVIEDICASDQDRYYHDIAIELMRKLVGKEQIVSLEKILSAPSPSKILETSD